MSLFSKYFGSKKHNIDYDDDQYLLVSKIDENFSLAQKYFERLDIIKQKNFVKVLNDNRYLINRELFLNDFEQYLNLSQSGIKGTAAFRNFIDRYDDQKWIEVDSFLAELSDYFFSSELSGIAPEDYYNIIYSVQQITLDKYYLEEYLFSSTLIRYLKNDLQENSKLYFKLFKTIPLWYSSHMYLDLLDSIKKVGDENSLMDSLLPITFNTSNNEQETFIRTLAFLN
jgi:hypothetical protein